MASLKYKIIKETIKYLLQDYLVFVLAFFLILTVFRAT
jgi:hypothetical protein